MVLDEVELAFDNGEGRGIIKIRRGQPNSAMTYIRKLLREGFRGNDTYFRDNDRRLILKVWEKEGLVLDKEQRAKFMHDVTAPETITRARRNYRGEFPESESVMKKRFNLFLEKKDEFSKGGFIKRFLKS